MLCAPPLCQPATHFLGCFSIRTGAAVVLVADALYGISLVALHAFLLSRIQEPPSELVRAGGNVVAVPAHERLLADFQGVPAAAVAPHGAEAAAAQPYAHPHQVTTWYVQVADLDIGFGHQLLGLSDHTNMMFGLCYGLATLLISGYMLQAIFGSSTARLPELSRYFTSFAHLQILLYVFISMIKLPKLCRPIQTDYLTHLFMECDLLWFLYVQRVVVGVIIGSLATWVFSSFSFILTFGHGAHAAVDRPEYTHALDHVVGGDAGPTSTYYKEDVRDVSPAVAPGRRGGPSLAPPPSRSNLVGPGVHAPPPRYGRGAAALSRSQLPPRGGVAGRGGGVGGPSYNVGRMPRASSSMQTTSTAISHDEHHPLIKAPVAIY